MSFFAYLVYKYLLSPAAWLVLQVARPFLRGKIREMIEDKNSHYQEVKNPLIWQQSPLWVHAASGEIEYARPLLREFKKNHPTVPILVTYSSPSAKKILKQIPEIDAWTALPWDLPFTYRRFFKTWKPQLLLVARTDLWPAMAQACFRQNLPAFMFSATFADNSSRLHGFSGLLTRFSLNRLQKIFCVSEADQINLKKLNLRTPVEILGDTRFDQVLFRLQHPKKTSVHQHAPHFTFIMGSTWPEDEKILLKCLGQIAVTPAQLIIAPHEIHEDHLSDLEKSLTSLGLTHTRYTKFHSWEGLSVLILDQIGVLAELYQFGDAAFVGGSFKKQVHSVMEPLAAGVPVLVGPFHRNNREALDFQKVSVAGVPLVTVVENEDQIMAALRGVIAARPENLKPQIVREIRQRTGVTQAVLDQVKPLLRQAPQS